ncbi:MAG: prolipoprotein diacylglyceryl transferase [Holophagaceae bacterium]|nr:prolipoprotein diacylglyceryl transferase [Holophagaceae bacterium]
MDCPAPPDGCFGAWIRGPHAVLLGYWAARAGPAVVASVRRLLGVGLGAKALHILTLLPVAHEVGWVALFGGKSILGAILGGHLGVEVAKKLVHETRRTGDLFVFPLCVGIAVGRVGCFLTGLADGTYGNPTALPWGVDFGDGVRRHPTQLYEVGFAVGFMVIALLVRKRLREGGLWRLFLAAYCLWRLLIDGLKPYPALAGLNAIQWAALAGLVWLAISEIRLRKQTRPEPAP